MTEAPSPPSTLIYWDESHVLSLLCEPEHLLKEEPWNTWIKQQGGLSTVYAALRGLPLSEKQRKTLNVLLNEPGASLQKYALSLYVSVATYVRYRASLVKTLATILNAHLLDKPPAVMEAAPTIAGARTNLPYQRLPLIGRDQEVTLVRASLLQAGTSLVTITGPGGIGKTRLALQVAGELRRDFPDGVFFVPLAAITDPDLVATTIIQTLGVKTGDTPASAELLKGYLQDKQLLLVLDNFEQITTAAALLTELLAVAPRLKILVTSRAVLHLYGEQEFSVPPLMVPNLNDLPAPEALARSPAVALFMDRAQAVKVDFALTAENAPTIAEICVKLEGIPLALELAAARIKLFEPNALLKELSHPLSLRALGAAKSTDRSPRHQTMRNAVAWSYQLLMPEAQVLFAQLGVFVGGCTLEATEAVCRVANTQEAPLLEQLASLVDQSMVQHKSRPNGEPRFTLLETLREYALERLEADGGLEAVRERHLFYYLEWVEAIEPGPKDPDLPAWMRALEEEHDNLRAALQWALERDEIEIALRIAGAVWKFWQIHGHAEEGAKWMKTILDRSEEHPVLARAKALWGAGWLGMVLSTLEPAGAYFEAGANLSRQLGDQRYLGLSLHGIGAVARGQGDFKRSRAAFEESLPLFQALGNTEDVAWTFEHLGVTALEQGDFKQSVAYLSQGLRLFQELGQRWPCAEALTFLGHAALQQGDYAEAQRRYEEALPIYKELEDKLNVTTLNTYIGASLYGRGNYQQAVHQYKESLVFSQEMKDYWSLAWGIERLAEAAEKLNQSERAARLWGAADALRRITGVLWHPGFHSYYTEGRFAALKSRLGEAQWQHLWAEGQALSLEGVVQQALAV